MPISIHTHARLPFIQIRFSWPTTTEARRDESPFYRFVCFDVKFNTHTHASIEDWTHQTVQLHRYRFIYFACFIRFVYCLFVVRSIIINFHFSQIVNRGTGASEFVCVLRKAHFDRPAKRDRPVRFIKTQIRSRAANGKSARLSIVTHRTDRSSVVIVSRHATSNSADRSDCSSSEVVNENCLMEQKIGISIWNRGRPFVSHFTHFSRHRKSLSSRCTKECTRKHHINRRQSQRRHIYISDIVHSMNGAKQSQQKGQIIKILFEICNGFIFFVFSIASNAIGHLATS